MYKYFFPKPIGTYVFFYYDSLTLHIFADPTYTAKQSNTSVRQGHSLDLPAEQQSVSSPVTTTTFKPISIEPPANSCSHCSIPTTPKSAPPIPAFNQPISNSPNQIGAAVSPKFPQGIKSFVNQPNGANLSPQQGSAQNYPNQPQNALQGVLQNYPTQPQNSLSGAQIPLEQGLLPPQNSQNIPQQEFVPGLNSPSQARIGSVQGSLPGPGFSNSLQASGPSTFPQQQLQTPQNLPTIPQNSYPGSEITQNSPNLGNVLSGRTPKRLDGEPPIRQISTQPNSLQRGLSNSQGTPNPTKPTLISAQMQIVDKNTDIYRRGPGENEGLPQGLTKDDMSTLLYTFNYTVGFHGHFEEGYTNGVKQGYYFVTGRNGVRTRVDYVADSNGFRPKISQEVLDLLSDDVPKPETEKEEKYGLKGYEFKWLYYPVEAKGR